MALRSGTRIGPYEILSTLGSGGMGSVHRARDTKLHRDVAIKVLLPAVANDPDRLSRFAREAQVLAALNHPNIAAIYGLEEVSSIDPGQAGSRALVMELVEGPTLDDRIAQGPIVIDEALSIATQIASALEAAHDQGIVHRDLKPSNVKVRQDGTVKVLDFGLAKALDPAPATASAVSSPTITSPAMTGAGVILGTAAYMSPEQARGRPVDKRADIFAFGAVLYEMLTARRAFPGDEVTDTLIAVLSKEPDWTLLPAGTPPRLREVLQRCLEKDPRRRWRDVGDARLQLEELRGSGSGPSGQLDDQAIAVAAARASKGTRFAWVATAIAGLVALALAIPAVMHVREAPPAPPPETRVDIVTPPSDDPVSFSLSPDGRQIVYVAASDGASRLWLRSLAGTTAQPLSNTEGATYPFWSPDGRSVAFFADEQLKRLDLDGGTPRRLAAARTGRGGAWNGEGVILFTPTITDRLFRISASGGDAVPVTTLDRQLSHRFPVFLPDGRHFLFYARGEPDTAGIHLGTLDASTTWRLTAAETAGVHLAPEWVLWLRGGTLVAQRLDLERRALVGDSRAVADAVTMNASYFGAVSVSASGLVAYRAGVASSPRQLTWFDRTGRTLGTLGEAEATIETPRISPDGRRVAVSRTVQGNSDIWLMDGARATRFTFDASRDDHPTWSPDGRRIAFSSIRRGPYELFLRAANGDGPEVRLVDSPFNALGGDWSTDGRFLLYSILHPESDYDLWVRPMEGDPTPWIFLKTPFGENSGRFSPDGRWVAYMSNESGRAEIYVRPFVPAAATGSTTAGPSGQWPVSTAGGRYPTWRADGRELYYVAPDGAMMAAPVTVQGTALAAGTPVRLFAARIPDNGNNQYDVARDGRFLINSILGGAAAAPITLVQNWRPSQ